jgi:hypothetical protein
MSNVSELCKEPTVGIVLFLAPLVLALEGRLNTFLFGGGRALQLEIITF